MKHLVFLLEEPSAKDLRQESFLACSLKGWSFTIWFSKESRISRSSLSESSEAGRNLNRPSSFFVIRTPRTVLPSRTSLSKLPQKVAVGTCWFEWHAANLKRPIRRLFAIQIGLFVRLKPCGVFFPTIRSEMEHGASAFFWSRNEADREASESSARACEGSLGGSSRAS